MTRAAPLAERLYYGGSLTTYALRPRVERRPLWPYAVVAAAFLFAAAQWMPAAKVAGWL